MKRNQRKIFAVITKQLKITTISNSQCSQVLYKTKHLEEYLKCFKFKQPHKTDSITSYFYQWESNTPEMNFLQGWRNCWWPLEVPLVSLFPLSLNLQILHNINNRIKYPKHGIIKLNLGTNLINFPLNREQKETYHKKWKYQTIVV